MPSLKDIRARLSALETKSSYTGDNAVYPHWNINEGDTAILRFLPDGNDSNPFFWVERAMIRLPFSGIKGGDTSNVIVQVPCVEMYGSNQSCPILADVRGWFKDPSLEEMGRKYWKKRSYMFQGFVRQDPMGEENVPENPIRRFMISPQIFTIIKASLLDVEMENLPTDYVAGLDLRVTKTTKGGYSDYSTSNWSRKETSLTEAELEAIEQHTLSNLDSFLPKKPSDVALKVMYEMFEASVDGQEYDSDKWSQYFRPAGIKAPVVVEDSSTPAPEVVVAPAPEVVVAPAPEVAVAPAPEVVAPTETGTDNTESVPSKAEDILAQIRARQSA